MWNEQRIEEEFVSAILNAGFVMLENPANTKINDIKNLLFELMTICIEKFGGEIKRM